MKYVPVPVVLLEIGKPLPVDVCNAAGQLLLRKGQSIESEAHREKLRSHQASTTEADALAWQRSYERMVHAMVRDGVDVKVIARAGLPSEIRESDYVVGQQFQGGWLDLQEVLRGILYQGGLAINPLQRLTGIENKAQELLAADPDDSLFCLFQALADDALGYCATHALLCAVMCRMTAQRVGIGAPQSHALLRAALTMNIGMAREQDVMARQSAAPHEGQRTLIRAHPEISAAILRGYGVEDTEQLDIVRWHHIPDSPEGLAQTLASRRLLAMVDGFVARLAARKTRSSLSAVKAVRSMVLGAEGDAIGVGSAIAQAVGFYPPGTYVQLVNGDTAVVVQRGQRANTPWVLSVADKEGMPLTHYQAKDTAAAAFAIAAAVDFSKVKVTVSLERVRKARLGLAR